MIARICFLVAISAIACAQAQTPFLIQQPAPSTPVISPLTSSSAASGQALLSQISSTLTQRSFEHQALTLQAAPAVETPVFSTKPIIIRAK